MGDFPDWGRFVSWLSSFRADRIGSEPDANGKFGASPVRPWLLELAATQAVVMHRCRQAGIIWRGDSLHGLLRAGPVHFFLD